MLNLELQIGVSSWEKGARETVFCNTCITFDNLLVKLQEQNFFLLFFLFAQY